ncbi:hypothetical protein T440DRAFT_42013 [Plenodomus tracheiphilus IPT5]|uniref:Uncharacterized protein n=1 Tax=Plenodomus tracheiphilus IPT5 TaxID=1408161 RepID=A0A6A7BDE4_9PLEO|nr:hypothetical protein T440DRAFT_42013 [Plenodomus tracheiphilus IPT5]
MSSYRVISGPFSLSIVHYEGYMYLITSFSVRTVILYKWHYLRDFRSFHYINRVVTVSFTVSMKSM